MRIINEIIIIKGIKYNKRDISEFNIVWFVHIMNSWTPYNIDINMPTKNINPITSPIRVYSPYTR